MVFVLLAMTGCSYIMPKPVVVERTKIKIIKIPEELTETVTATPPPTPKMFMALDTPSRYRLLFSIIGELQKDIGQCNNKLEGIREFVKAAETVVNSEDKKD